LCLLALMRLRYLCLLIFLRRFLISEPMQCDPCFETWMFRAELLRGPH
jgi:hypothetical protein